MAQFAIDEILTTGIAISGFVFDVSNNIGTNGYVLTSTSSGVMWQQDSSNADLSALSGQIAATGTLLNNRINSLSGYVNGSFISGSGIQNYVPRWNSAKELITGSIYDLGTGVGIGTTRPVSLLTVGAAGSTSAANGISFGGDVSSNIYRDSNASIRTDGGFLAASRIRTLDYIQFNTNLYPNAFTNYIDINIGNLAANNWQSAIRINPGGYVGVGTTQPSGKLHVVSTIAGETVLRADGTNGTLFSVTDDLSDSLMSVNNSAGLPVFEVFADDRIVGGQYGSGDFVLVNNKVGIGTTNPAYKLHVLGDTLISGNLTNPTIIGLSGVLNITGSTLDAKINTLSGYSNNTFATITNLAATGSVLDTKINTTNTNLAATGSVLDTKINTLSGYANSAFLSGVGVSNYVPRWSGTKLLVTGSIYDLGTGVGIGTTSPSAKFNVYGGNTIFRNDVVGGASAVFIRNWASSPTTSLTFGNNPSDDSSTTLDLTANVFSITNYGDPGSFIKFGTRNDSTADVRVTIDPSGRVGIGAVNLSSLLTVGGAGSANSFSGISFGEDTSANLYRSAAGALKTDASLGIGINPVQKLQVEGVVGNPASIAATQSGIFRISNTTDNAVLDFGIRAGGLGAWIQSTDETALDYNYPLLLNPNGARVGIGLTTSISGILHVRTPAAGDQSLLVLEHSAGYSNNTENRIDFFDDEPHKIAARIAQYYSTDANNRWGLKFYTNPSAAINPIPALTLRGNNNVGVGTTSPIERLHVSGNIHVQAESNTVGGNGIYLGDVTNRYLAIRQTSTDKNFAFDTYNNTESWVNRLTILNNGGNVGINSTAPNTKLRVNGSFSQRASGTAAIQEYKNITTFNYDGYSNGGYVVKTPFRIGSTYEMSIVHVKGYGYGGSTLYDFKVVFYDYEPSNAPINYSIVDLGNDGSPKYLAKDSNNYIQVCFGQTGDVNYYYRFTVDCITTRYDNDFSQGWGMYQTTGANFGFASTGIYQLNSPLNFRTNLNVGLGTTNPQNKLSVIGSVNIGSNNFNTAAPTNGLIIEGNVGIGLTNPVTYINGDPTSFRPNPAGKFLDIYSSANEANINLITNNSGDGSGIGGLYFTRARGQSDNHYQIAAIKGLQDGTNGLIAGGKLYFYTKQNGSNTLLSSPAMVINSNADVGIGTTQPGGRLHVSGSNGHVLYLNQGVTGAQGGLYFQNVDQFAISSARLYFISGDSVLFTRGPSNLAWAVSQNANVGIGVTNPSEKLTITGAVKILTRDGANFKVGDGSNNNTFLEFDYPDISTSNAYFRIFRNTNTVGGKYFQIFKGDGTATSQTLLNANGDSHINAIAGNLGIGTDSPNHLLNLSTVTSDTSIGLYTTTSNTSARNWLISANDLAYGDFSLRQSLAISGNPRTSGVSRFYINNNGNVGIATTSPGYSLQIGQNASGNNTDYSLGILRHGTLTYPGSWTSNPAFKIIDLSDGGPSNVDIYGLINLELPRFQASDTNAEKASLFLISFDTALGPFRIDGKGNTWVGYDRVTTGTNLSSFSTLIYGGLAVGDNYQTTTLSNGQAIFQGNVGIGVTNPGVKLQVANTGTISSIATVRLVGSTGNNAGSQIEFYKAQNPKASIGLASAVTGGLSDDLLLLSSNPNSIILTAGSNGLAVFKPDGKVGIGIYNPISLLSIGGAGSTSSASGITFGQDAEANLYRSAEDTVKTDGSVIIGSDLYVADELGVGVPIANKRFNYGAEVEVANASIQLVLGRLGNATGQGAIGADSSNVFAVWNVSGGLSKPFVISQQGNVGIGYDTTSYKLEVNGNASFTKEVYFQNQSLAYFYGRTGFANKGTILFNNGSSQNLVFGEIANDIYSFGPGASGAAPTSNTLTLDNSNIAVGIGVTNPSGKLHLANIGFTDQATVADTNLFPNNTGVFGLVLDGGYTNGLYRHRFIKVDRSANLPLYLQQAGAVADQYLNLVRFGTHSQSTDTFEVFGSSKINGSVNITSTLLTSGNVGIGTASPTYQLTVIGANQATANLTDAGVKGGSVLVASSVNATNQGGAVLFATKNDSNTYTPQSAIKSLFQNGNGYGLGDLAFSSRLATGDTNLTEVLRIKYDGKVGIGTTNPTQKLEVSGTVKIQSLGAYSDPTDNAAFLNYDTNGGIFTLSARSNGGNTYMAFRTSNGGTGNERVRITNNGFVGISSNAPIDYLDFGGAGKNIVFGYATYGEVLNSAASIVGNNVKASPTANSQVRRFANANDQGNFIKLIYNKGVTFHTNITSALNTDVSEDTNERMRINLSGDVGIGTSIPNGKLHVVSPDSTYAFSVAGATKGVRFNINSAGTYIQGVDNTLAGSYQSLILGGSDLYFQTNGITNAMYINSSGNVGVNTTTPDTNAKLHVYGNDAHKYIFYTDTAGSSSTLFQRNNAAESLVLTLANTRGPSVGSDRGTSLNLDLGYGGSAGSAGTFARGAKISALAFTTYTSTASTQNAYLAFYTATGGSLTEKVRIQADGKVGIGISSPITLLSVGGTGSTMPASGITFGEDAQVNLYRASEDLLKTDAAFTAASLSSSSYVYAASYLQTAGGQLYAGAPYGTLTVYVGNVAQNAWEAGLYVGRGSYVGIGTTQPSGKLHVVSTVAGETVLRADGTNGTLFSVTDDLSDSLMSVNNSAGLPVLEVFADDRVVAGQYGSGDFVITNNKVGIGTTNPNNKLSVIGAASIGSTSYNVTAPTNGLLVEGNVGIGTTNPTTKLSVIGEIYASSRVISDRYASVVNGNNNSILFSSNTTSFINNGSTAVYIQSDGKVGIGTIAPTGFLTIQGNSNQLRLQTANDPGNFYTYISSLYDSSHPFSISVANNNASTAEYFGVYADVGGANNRIALLNGNVGIGTTVPTGLLNVVRNANTAQPIASFKELFGTPPATNILLLERGNNLTAVNQISSNAGLRIRDHLANYSLSVEDHNSNVNFAISGTRVMVSSRGTSSLLNIGGAGSAAATSGITFGEDAQANLYRSAEDTIKTDGSLIVVGNVTAANLVSGNGTANYITKWNGTKSIANSQIFDDGTYVGVNTAVNTTYRLQVNGSFAATTKSFDITHPTISGKRLIYASLEGPENGVYFRGKNNNNEINLPHYWSGLVHEDSITANLTSIGKRKDGRIRNYSVDQIGHNKVYIYTDSDDNIYDYYYTIFAERKDVSKLVIERDME